MAFGFTLWGDVFTEQEFEQDTVGLLVNNKLNKITPDWGIRIMGIIAGFISGIIVGILLVLNIKKDVNVNIGLIQKIDVSNIEEDDY